VNRTRWVRVLAVPGLFAVAALATIAVWGGDVDDLHAGRCSTDLLVAVTTGWWYPEVVLLDGEGARVLVPGEVTSDPSFSPDGSEVALVRSIGDYESAGPESTELWVVPVEGGDPRVLVTGSALVETPDWSPDGRTIAYTDATIGGVVGSGPFHEIRTVRADGSGDPVTLFALDLQRILAPSWSPDGTAIAYVRAGGVHEVGVVDSDGGEHRTVAVVPDAQAVAWSPDGQHLLVSTSGSLEGRSLVLVDVRDGSSEVASDKAARATWASDGSVHHLLAQDDHWRFARSTISDGRLVHDRFLDEPLEDDAFTQGGPWATNDAACPD
jgi:Tol biopolymer transport system component